MTTKSKASKFTYVDGKETGPIRTFRHEVKISGCDCPKNYLGPEYPCKECKSPLCDG